MTRSNLDAGTLSILSLPTGVESIVSVNRTELNGQGSSWF